MKVPTEPCTLFSPLAMAERLCVRRQPYFWDCGCVCEGVLKWVWLWLLVWARVRGVCHLVVCVRGWNWMWLWLRVVCVWCTAPEAGSSSCASVTTLPVSAAIHMLLCPGMWPGGKGKVRQAVAHSRIHTHTHTVIQVTIVCCIWHACTADNDWQRANTGAKCYDVPCRVCCLPLFYYYCKCIPQQPLCTTIRIMKHQYKKQKRMKLSSYPCWWENSWRCSLLVSWVSGVVSKSVRRAGWEGDCRGWRWSARLHSQLFSACGDGAAPCSGRDGI